MLECLGYDLGYGPGAAVQGNPMEASSGHARPGGCSGLRSCQSFCRDATGKTGPPRGVGRIADSKGPSLSRTAAGNAGKGL